MVGGNGGSGVAISITGTSTYYGGGGGGGKYAGTGPATSGGKNGGGGSAPGTGSGTAGAVNTGGGGGGASGNTIFKGENGGSGVVILRVLTADIGTYTGSVTVTTSGLYTILKFTTSGTYTTPALQTQIVASGGAVNGISINNNITANKNIACQLEESHLQAVPERQEVPVLMEQRVSRVQQDMEPRVFLARQALRAILARRVLSREQPAK